MEEFIAEGDLICGSLALEVSQEKNISMWLRDCSCDILAKNVAAFCPCLKSLPEAKVKRVKLIALTKEFSKQFSLDSVLWFNFVKNVWMKCSKFRKEKKLQSVWIT